MMFNYLVDENLPSTIPFWNKKNFIHGSTLANVRYDTDIWEYAIRNELVIITRDTNFYYRSLALSDAPKVVWIRTGKIGNRKFNKLLKSSWKKIEIKLLSKSFIQLKLKR